MSRFGRSVSSCVLTFILAVTSFASGSSTATLTGRVIDPNGAVIVGAKVDATNIDTNVTSSTETNSEGLFVINNLLPGRYRIFIQKQGFQTIVKPEVELHVQDVISLNFSMQIGSVTQSVTIEGGASLAQTETAAVGTLVNRQFVENLPLNGRTFQTLIALAPGAVLTSTPFDDGQFSVNGQRANANYFTVDGVSANIGVNPNVNPGQAIAGSTAGFSALGTTSNLVSVDAMQEFRIQTSTFAPEFGRTPGAQVSIITRSGTNGFHGAGFDYVRNDVLDANDWFNNRLGFKKPALRQNDFGGVLGGPIIKNRTFFFFSYEGFRLRVPRTRITQVPSLNARQLASAAVKPIFNAYPIPNGRDLANNISEFSATFSDPSKLDSTSVRVDHTVSNKLTIFGRYSDAPSQSSSRGLSRSLNSVISFTFNTRTLTGGMTLAVTPAINNDLRVNYSRNSGKNDLTADNFGGAMPPPQLLPSPFSTSDSEVVIVLIGATNANLGVGRFNEAVQRQINLVDTLSLVKRSHQLKFGVDYRRLFPISNPFRYILNVFNSVNGFLTDRATVSVQATTGTQLFPIFNNLSFFGQDTWKIASRLTLTYGARWELNPAPHEKNGHNPLALTNVDSLASLAFAPAGTSLYKTTYGNFAPRVGIAYQLSQRRGGETVLRGGFGIFYDLGSGQSVAQLGNAFPNAKSRPAALVSLNPLDPAALVPPVISLTPPFSDLIPGGVDPNLELPRTYQWNIAIERSFGANQILTATYVAAVGRRLLRQERVNVAAGLNPTLFTAAASLNLTRNGATSDYHALQLHFQRRLSRGFQALASYTWSKSLDNASTDASSEAPIVKIDLKQERGSSSFDVRHAFNLAVTYDIPKPSRGTVAKALLGDWSVDSILRARSALPVNVVTGADVFGTGNTFGGNAARPDLIPGVPLYVSDPTVAGGRRINKAAFDSAKPVAAKRQGTLGRNALRGFGMWQMDFALRRQFSLTERVKLQFRAEAFNIFNHPNFADPGMGVGFSGTNVLTNALFGQSISTLAGGLSGGQGVGLNPIYQVGGARSTQMSLKLVF